jgi:pimeloyl-ACP methyl ester carboxylesterase
MDTNASSDRWWTSKDGLKLYARDYAGAEGAARLPVICIHGLTRNSRDFEAVAPYLAASGRRVLAVDVRGRGRSAYDPKPMNYHPATYAKDILALLDQAGISRAVFVGTSMGGLITMVVTAFRSRAIAGAVLNDVGPVVSPVGLARIASYVGKGSPVQTWDDAAGYVRTNNQAAFPHYGDDDWLTFARRCFREDATGKPVLDYDPDIAVPMRAAGPKALAANLWPMFRKLARRAPLMVVRGETSDILDAAIARKMRDAAPRMGFTEIPGVGHAPMLDEPAAKDAILTFLAKLP